MIEITLRKFLESKLNVPVLMEIPKEPASHFVIIEKTGSTHENHVDSAIMTIQSYAPSLQSAMELNELVKYWMLDGTEGLITLDEIASVNLNSDYNYTDTTSKRYRYQSVFEIVHY